MRIVDNFVAILSVHFFYHTNTARSEHAYFKVLNSADSMLFSLVIILVHGNVGFSVCCEL